MRSPFGIWNLELGIFYRLVARNADVRALIFRAQSAHHHFRKSRNLLERQERQRTAAIHHDCDSARLAAPTRPLRRTVSNDQVSDFRGFSIKAFMSVQVCGVPRNCRWEIALSIVFNALLVFNDG